MTEAIITTEGNGYQNDDGKQYKTYHGGGNNGNTYTRRKTMGADIENGVKFHTNGNWGSNKEIRPFTMGAANTA